jgi:hypothetical protein
MACLTNHTRLLNQLYDVPPPSPLELLGRQSTDTTAAWSGRVAMLPDDDRQPGGPPYAQTDWPHFGDDFLKYEQIMERVGYELFGDILQIAHARESWANRGDEFVVQARDIGSDHATALGWSISWYGFSRTCTPKDAASMMPAVGLAGWLANAPYRPVDVPRSSWRDQMIFWLSEDLARSAWAWSRIALFMRARGNYLLHGQLARPSELATLRSCLSSRCPAEQFGTG